MTNAMAAPPDGRDSPLPGGAQFAALIGGNVALAIGPWMVRLADTGPVSAGFWRLLLPIPLFALLAFREGGHLPRLDRRAAIVLAAGVFFALDLGSWHVGITMTRLGNATLFGNSGSVILMIWGLVMLRRWPGRLDWLALSCAVGGAGILLAESLEISTRTLGGDLFCLLAGLFYAFYLLPVQKVRASLGQFSVLLLVCCAGAPVLLLIALALGEPVMPGNWAPVIGLAVSSQIVGQGLLVYALRFFSPVIVGMALLTQPAVASLIGWLAFGETLGVLDLIGMGLLAGALVIARITMRAR